MTNLLSEAIEAAQALVESVVIDINIKENCVEFIFLGEKHRVIVRVKKLFTFHLPGESSFFDPSSLPGERVLSASQSAFIFFRGHKCSSMLLGDSSLDMQLGVIGGLKVEFDSSDFEPLELMGFCGERFDALDFYYVL